MQWTAYPCPLPRQEQETVLQLHIPMSFAWRPELFIRTYREAAIPESGFRQLPSAMHDFAQLAMRQAGDDR